MPQIISKKSSRSKRLIACATVSFACLVTVPLAVSWDAGPASCAHNVCSGGKTEGSVTEYKGPTAPDGQNKQERLRGNTHLWIVNHAVAYLHEGNPEEKKIAAAMDDQACRAQWEKGLFDADEPPYSETGGATGTHFYNPTGISFDGKPGAPQRYSGMKPARVKGVFHLLVGKELGNARDNAEWSLGGFIQPADNTLDKRLESLKKADGCEWFGYALHYLTDETQPMHSGSFSAVSASPGGMGIIGSTGFNLHGSFEYWVPVIQAEATPKPANEVHIPNAKNADAMFVDVATKFSDMGKGEHGLYAALVASPGNCKIVGDSSDPYHYRGPCFPDSPLVKTKTIEILRDAYEATGQYIYAALVNGPGDPK